MPGQPPVPKKTAPVDVKVRRHKIAAPAATANETTLQRFLDTQSDSVDGVLAWLNGTFSYTAPAKTATKGVVNPPMPLTTRAGLTVGGAVSAGSVTSSGAVSGTTASFPGSAFKYAVGPYTYASTSYPGGIIWCAWSYGSSTLPTNAMGFAVPFAGNVVAMSGRVYCTSSTTFQPYYTRNNAAGIQLSSATVNNAYVGWGATYAKGVYPVNVGDFVALGVGFSTASVNVQFSGFITLEAAP